MKTVNYNPLYKLVKKSILSRIADQEWVPGAFLPSEPELAKEYEVSHGTLRRALDELTRERRLTRHQGKGTAVSLLDSELALFQFFKIYDKNGERVFPTADNIKIAVGMGKREGAVKEEAVKLNIAAGERVVRIQRVRRIKGLPVFNELITVPEKRFPNLQAMPIETLPNTLYDFYQKEYAVTITTAEERLSAIFADKTDAQLLDIPEGTPLLSIVRVCYDIKNEPVEYRRTHMLTQSYSYYAVVNE